MKDFAHSFGRVLWAVTGMLTLLSIAGCGKSQSKGSSHRSVVAYCAQDEEYAEPIFRDFEKATGIRVLPVFDDEAVKTVGLANRLYAERANPQCDIFWGNEELRTRELAAQNVFRETNGWIAFGYRSRRLVINTNLVRLSAAPHSLLELTNRSWAGKVAVAYPQFGTTGTYFLALRQYWGTPGWEAWCRGLAANQPLLVDGNSVVVKMVGEGKAWIGLSDSDDVAAGQREGMPVAALPMNEETLLIPNTVGITRGAPHSEAAEHLMEYLKSPAVVERLIQAHALEGQDRTQAPVHSLEVDWQKLLQNLHDSTEQLNGIFLRH